MNCWKTSRWEWKVWHHITSSTFGVFWLDWDCATANAGIQGISSVELGWDCDQVGFFSCNWWCSHQSWQQRSTAFFFGNWNDIPAGCSACASCHNFVQQKCNEDTRYIGVGRRPSGKCENENGRVRDGDIVYWVIYMLLHLFILVICDNAQSCTGHTGHCHYWTGLPPSLCAPNLNI